MDPWIQIIATIVCSVLASSGLWAFLAKRLEKNDSKTKLLIGIAHDRITFLGMSYVHRGWITQEEYESLYKYLYQPYLENGGNGSAKRVMAEVEKLPIRKAESTIMAKLD